MNFRDFHGLFPAIRGRLTVDRSERSWQTLLYSGALRQHTSRSAARSPNEDTSLSAHSVSPRDSILPSSSSRRVSRRLRSCCARRIRGAFIRGIPEAIQTRSADAEEIRGLLRRRPVRGRSRAGRSLIAARFPRAYLDVNREPYELDPELFAEPLPDYANTQSVRVVGGLGTIARIVADGEEIYRDRLPVSEGARAHRAASTCRFTQALSRSHLGDARSASATPS